MGVVTDGIEQKINAQGERRHALREGGRSVARIQLDDGKRVQLVSNRKDRTLAIEAALTKVQAHFGGLSRSEALRISLMLTARAIDQNKALPEVSSDSR